MSTTEKNKVAEVFPDTSPAGDYDKDMPEYVHMTDPQLMDELFKRGIEIPMADKKLVRVIAIKQIVAWDEAARPLNSYPKVRVIFHRSGREAEAPYVFLALNGVGYQAPYEKEVVIPEPVLRTCVDNAAITEFEMKDFDTVKGQAVYDERVVRAVPYTFLGYVDNK